MEKTKKLWMVLLVTALLALGGCAGYGRDGDSDAPGRNGSITDCFTVNKTVNFTLASSNAQLDQVLPNRSTAGPTTYNGQAVTGQIFFYPKGSIAMNTDYWTVTNSGVALIASVHSDGTVVPDGSFYPYNMNPGQTATDSSKNVTTLVGFESISLAGKTFTNICHFKGVTSAGAMAETWFAPGYGMIKQIETTGTMQYNGDL